MNQGPCNEVRRLLEQLRPDRHGDTDVEPWPHYRERVRLLLPNFPDSALEQWLHRHYPHAVSDYGWLGLRRLTFQPKKWPTERVLTDVGSLQSDLIKQYAERLRSDPDLQQKWLGRRLIEDGTWPVPILVISNHEGISMPNGLRLATPFHLMEGHRRMGYLHALVEDKRWTPAAEHELWLVQPDSAAILNYWPMND